jgi:hypothetical protein
MQGSFDSSGTSLREIPAPLKMTTWERDQEDKFGAVSTTNSEGSGRQIRSGQHDTFGAVSTTHADRRRSFPFGCAQGQDDNLGWVSECLG